MTEDPTTRRREMLRMLGVDRIRFHLKLLGCEQQS